jgi:hypothetical protein
MTIDPHAHIPMDPGRIHLLDPLELAWWCRELKCTEAELRTAVAAVGEHPTQVREELHRARA